MLTLAEAVAAVPGADEKAARYLLGLMERFEMCFTLEEAEEQGPLDSTQNLRSPQPLDGARDHRRWLVPGALGRISRTG